MRRLALTAAGLLTAVSLALFLATSVRANASVRHTCSATDRQFIDTAKTNIAAIGLWGQEYLHGDARPGEVVSEAKQAAKIVMGTAPTDPSLSTTRSLLNGMFTEYGKAVHARAKHRDAGPHMYRAYGLANYAHGVLAKAQPPLFRLGCDLTPLL